MAFNIPTEQELLKRARNAFRAFAKGTDAWIWPSNPYVVAKVLGGMTKLLFMRLNWVNKQRFVTTCTDWDELKLHGAELGITQKQASNALGYVAVALSYPSSIAAGTIFTRADGVTFTADNTVAALQYATSSVVLVAVTCSTAGKSGNTLANTPLTTTATDASGRALTVLAGPDGIGQGADAETFAQLQERILFRKRNPPMGGAEYDYVSWGKELPGVTRVFATGNAFGPGTVGVWFLMDDTYSFGIPQTIDVTTMQAYLDTKKPVTATVIVQAPQADCIDIVVKGIYPDTQQARLSVAAEMLAVFRRMTKPGLPNAPFVLRHSWLEQAVSNTTGDQYNEGVTAPASDLTFGTGVMPCIKSITFIS